MGRGTRAAVEARSLNMTRALAVLFLAGVLGTTGVACKGKRGSAETGPDCDTEFDREKFRDKWTQCKVCERQHRGMGSMEADCKNAIAEPWK